MRVVPVPLMLVGVLILFPSPTSSVCVADETPAQAAQKLYEIFDLLPTGVQERACGLLLVATGIPQASPFEAGPSPLSADQKASKGADGKFHVFTQVQNSEAGEVWLDPDGAIWLRAERMTMNVARDFCHNRGMCLAGIADFRRLAGYMGARATAPFDRFDPYAGYDPRDFQPQIIPGFENGSREGYWCDRGNDPTVPATFFDPKTGRFRENRAFHSNWDAGVICVGQMKQ